MVTTFDMYDTPLSSPQRRANVLADAPLPRILCVDDDSNVLDGLRRTLRGSFNVVTATGPRNAMAILEQDIDFAVIVTDLRMPDIDGIVLLNQVRDGAPDIVRVVLTGYADADAAIRAVNDGQVYRFLTKPCPPALLQVTLDNAVEHQRVMKAERVLLEQTLQGSVELLTELFALTQPAAFGRAGRLKRSVSELATRMGVRDRWAIELAALFSQLGTVTLPPGLVEKVYHRLTLTDEERALVDEMPAVAERLVAHIPRLEPVRQILRYQFTHYNGEGSPEPQLRSETLPIGARLLAIVRDFDTLEGEGLDVSVAIDTMFGRHGWYDHRALNTFSALRGSGDGLDIRELSLAEVIHGMIFVNDVLEDDLLLVARGQEVTDSVLDRIRHHWARFAANIPVRVIVPRA